MNFPDIPFHVFLFSFEFLFTKSRGAYCFSKFVLFLSVQRTFLKYTMIYRVYLCWRYSLCLCFYYFLILFSNYSVSVIFIMFCYALLISFRLHVGRLSLLIFIPFTRGSFIIANFHSFYTWVVYHC